MRTLVMGDIHGAHKAMVQCLEKSRFDYQNDLLIQLGDIADGYPQVYECVEELLSIKNLIAIKGNHDDWLTDFIQTDLHPYFWNHGGVATLISYLEHSGKPGRYFASGSGYKTSLDAADIPEHHKAFFNAQELYYIDEQKRCFVHAGFKRNIPFLEQRPAEYYWNRSLWEEATLYKDAGEVFDASNHFSEIYIGHTPTTKAGSDKPMHSQNIYNLDTGAGGPGKLTIMDIETKEFWQSETTALLYA